MTAIREVIEAVKPVLAFLVDEVSRSVGAVTLIVFAIEALRWLIGHWLPCRVRGHDWVLAEPWAEGARKVSTKVFCARCEEHGLARWHRQEEQEAWLEKSSRRWTIKIYRGGPGVVRGGGGYALPDDAEVDALVKEIRGERQEAARRSETVKCYTEVTTS